MSANERIQPFDPTRRSPRELLTVYSRIIHELKHRGITRSSNNPAADYAEWLISKHLNLTLAAKSSSGCDASDEEGIRYEIKCRRVSPANRSRQLSPFRGLELRHFDFLAGVLFEEDFSVMKACLVPWQTIREHSTYRKHVNGNIFHLRDSLWLVPGVEDITMDLQMAQLEADQASDPLKTQ